MKKKIEHYKSVWIHTNKYVAKTTNLPNILVRISTFPEEVEIGRFYIPTATATSQEVFDKAVASRAKRDLFITYDHWSGGSI
jgi:hypothetical protein